MKGTHAMPTEINETFVQTLITAFTEHPEALKTLLENKPINDALAAYLQAAADRLRPKQEWNHIFTQRGETRRRLNVSEDGYVLSYPEPMPTNKIEVVAICKVYYDTRFRVAALFGGMTHAVKDVWHDQGQAVLAYSKETRYKRVGFFEEPSAAIEWAQGLFGEIEVMVKTATEPLSGAAHDADHADA
jgi:hypothetical protein